MSKSSSTNQTSEPDFPLCQLELTYLCNQTCSYCYKKNPRFAKLNDLLRHTDWIEIARTLDTNVFRCCLISGGESLCEEELVLSILDQLPSSLEYVSLLSNGAMLDYDMACRIKRKRGNIMVQVSLDGVTKGVHEYGRNTPGSWAEAIICCLALNRADITYSISTAVSNHNLAHVPLIVELAYGLGASQIHIAEQLRWTSSGYFLPTLHHDQRARLEASVKAARVRWANLLQCYLAPSYENYLEILSKRRWGGVLIRPDGSYWLDCLLPVGCEPGWPIRSPSKAMVEAAADSHLWARIRDYTSEARPYFVRTSISDEPPVNSVGFREISSFLIERGVGDWACTPRPSIHAACFAGQRKLNREMEIVVRSILRGMKVRDISKCLMGSRQANLEMAFMNTLVAIQQLIDCGLVEWEAKR